MTTYRHTAIEQALAAGNEPQKSLPFILAGPVVRRAEPNGVWFWFACSQEITGCTPAITVYDSKGVVNHTLANDNGWMRLGKPEVRIARLGERLWIALVKAQPLSGQFAKGAFYGYELTIQGPNFSTSLTAQQLDLAYAPFRLPTFMLANKDGQRLVQGSCRRPGASGGDAYATFDAWLRTPQPNPGGAVTPISNLSHRPSGLILTGDQIYADDVTLPLFKAVQRLAREVFGYVERVPTHDGRGTVSVDEYGATKKGAPAPANSRKALTSGGKSPIGFTTDDGEAHLLSFPEFAAMYLLVLNDELWDKRRVDVGADRELTGFPKAVGASRRVLANMVTYMIFDDHEITDDWNMDLEWVMRTGTNQMARRVVANGLAAYWAFQGWGNDPDAFEHLKRPITAHLDAMRGGRGTPAGPAAAFDRDLFAQHWSFVASTSPPALCVDTRTRREFPMGRPAILSGPKVWKELRPLAARHRLRKGAPLLLVLPTPLLSHPVMPAGQSLKFGYPARRYEGDYELYVNNPEQRAELIRELHAQLDPPSIVIFSGDVHHGFVVSGLYVGGTDRKAIELRRGAWGIRVAQVTSSPIKNVNSNLVEWGNVGEETVRLDGTLYDERKPEVDPPGYQAVGVRWDIRDVKGDLGHESFVFENHLCVVDIPTDSATGEVRALFVGNKNGSVETAAATVPLGNDPKTFAPSPKTPVRSGLKRAVKAVITPVHFEAEQPEPAVLAAVGGPPGIYRQTAIEASLGISRAASGTTVKPVPSAPPPAPAPPSPSRRAAADAKVVLDRIKATAKAGAKAPLSVPVGSRFYKRLTDFYLKDYLAAPSPANGKTAAEAKIGKTFAGPATAGDKWETGALKLWNKQEIPPEAHMLQRKLPTELAAATDILSLANRKHLPNIDVPQLIGDLNMGREFEDDVKGGGTNISQLMHWGTGVKYSHIDKLAMRELFLAYELWHLEGWDVFGEDPINDLISEEAGRILGTQLRAGAITKANLQAKLDEGFAEARAWVGTLLRPRLAELDRWALSETQPPARIWYGHGGLLPIWGPHTITSLLKGGATVDAVETSDLAERITAIYRLIYAADAWEAAKGKIDNGANIPMLIKGVFAARFEQLAKEDAKRLKAKGFALTLGAPAIAAGEADVPTVPLLVEHRDTPPDMILRWNAIAGLSRGIDVVVHLHGFSTNRRLDLRAVKLPVSGLDFAPPAAIAGLPGHPTWAGRGRPTLLVLPRGRARAGHTAAYDFPALVRAGGLAQLIDAALREFEARVGAKTRVEPRRVILTAHSGGGAALDRILRRSSGTLVDPHEVHVFDALYGDASGLQGWLARRLQGDVERLRAGVPDPAGYMAAEGCALRTLYLHGSERHTTRPSSLAAQATADGIIPAGQPFTALLKRHYRTEVARVEHSATAYWYGGRLLADVTADVPGPAASTLQTSPGEGLLAPSY